MHQSFKVIYIVCKKHEKAVLSLACEHRRISGCRLSPPKTNDNGDKRQPEIRLRSQAILSLTFSYFHDRNNCSFGGEIAVKDELIFFSDMPGNRVHVIDVQKQKVSTL